MKPIQFYTIKSSGGLKAEISNLGAKITKLLVANRKGEVKDIVLGFRTAEEWRTKETYFNAICGRVANRIKDGKFTLDGKTYQLPVNNGTNSLHGGVEGFNAKIWEVVEQSIYEIKLRYRAKDGEEGYPGNADIYVTYTVTKDNRLVIHYEAKTDAPTLVAMTNHAYFNLAGEDGGRVDEHILQVFADRYTPFDDTACPTGEILPVEGTPMDFRQPTRIGDRIHDKFFEPGRGIDNNCDPPGRRKDDGVLDDDEGPAGLYRQLDREERRKERQTLRRAVRRLSRGAELAGQHQSSLLPEYHSPSRRETRRDNRIPIPLTP